MQRDSLDFVSSSSLPDIELESGNLMSNAADKPGHPLTSDGKVQGWKRQELFAAGGGKLFDFINKELLPHLHALDVDPRTNLPNPSASPKNASLAAL